MKARNLFSKILAGALAVLMLVGLLPMFASADEVPPQDAAANGLYLTKNATLEDDGTYTIDLEAYVTGTVKVTSTTTSKPTDIVLVLDVSTSMYQPADGSDGMNPDESFTPSSEHQANGAYYGYYAYWGGSQAYPVRWYNGQWQYRAGNFDGASWLSLSNSKKIYKSLLAELIDAVKVFTSATIESNSNLSDDQKHQISIVAFGSSAVIALPLTSNADSINSTIIQLADYARAYTQAEAAMSSAITALENSSTDRAKAVIFFTDGLPSSSSTFNNDIAAGAIDNALTLKQGGASVFTISVLPDANVNDTSGTASNADVTAKMNTYMNAMSSNFPDATTTGGGYPIVLNDGSTSDGFYKKAESASDLSSIFGEIQNTIISGSASYNLDSNAVLKDIMNDGFSLANATATAAVYNYNFSSKSFAASASASLDAEISGNSVSVTGFDYSKHFVPLNQTNDNPNGGKKVVVKITGVVPTDEAVTNDLISTNNALSGMYDKADSAEPVEPFLQPQTILTNYAYVVDYAKSFDIDSDDWKMDTVQHYASTMAKFTSANTTVPTMKYGTLSGNTYTPNTMKWDGYDSFYVFGESTDTTVTGASANANGNLWSKVSIIPANNVYYEDTFVTTETGAAAGAGIYFSDDWSQASSAGDNAEAASNSVHGWVDSLNGELTDSDGTVAHGTTGATATFTFTGTGFDIYSRTTGLSGTILVKVAPDATASAAGVKTKWLVIDTVSVSGDYYQIPTVSYAATDANGNSVHGTYTVTLTVTSAAQDVGGETGRINYYLDGIRIYNPLSDETEADTTVSDAYTETELNAVFSEVRDLMATTGSGKVFIDEDASETVAVQTDYNATEYGQYGPANEVYLAQGQQITFTVDTTNNPLFQIGLKAPNGATSAEFSKDGTSNSRTTINHAADMYYTVVPVNGVITIENTGSGLLSITKIKMTGGAEGQALMLLEMTEEEAIAEFNAFSLRSTVEYNTDTEVEEPEAPEVPEEPETPEEPDIDIEIENPTEPEKPERPQRPSVEEQIEQVKKLVSKIFNAFRGWFGR